MELDTEFKKINRHILLWEIIVLTIVMVGMSVFGYIVGYRIGRDEVVKTTETIHITATEVTEPPSEALRVPVTDETVFKVDPDELEMLAIVIYQEAGGNGSCDDCRRYVADIVLNRVADERFPNTIEEVLTQKNQYGKLYYTGIKWASRAKNPGEADAVARAYRIADEVLSGQHSKLYGQGYIW